MDHHHHTKSMKNLKTTSGAKMDLIPSSSQGQVFNYQPPSQPPLNFYPKAPKEEELSISSRCIKITKDDKNQNHLVLQLDQEQLKQLTQNKNCKSFKIKLVKGNEATGGGVPQMQSDRSHYRRQSDVVKP